MSNSSRSWPYLLDLYCGAGGSARGYWDAGYAVLGIDISDQPNYPFTFDRSDALAVLERVLVGTWTLPRAIHASPPCQHFTKYGNTVKDIKERYEDLLPQTRELLRAIAERYGTPYIIENVEGAPLEDPVRLCGSMFDGAGTNDLQRHRLFETNWPLEAPGKCDHSIWPPDRYPGGRSVSRGGHSKALVRKTVEIGSWDIPLSTQKWAMGFESDASITVRELSEAVPPAYTLYVGRQLRAHLGRA